MDVCMDVCVCVYIGCDFGGKFANPSFLGNGKSQKYIIYGV